MIKSSIKILDKVMKERIFITLLVIVFLFGCHSKSQETITEKQVETVYRDWTKIQESGILKVMITYSSTSYFLYRGQPMGFEYELLQRLAADLNLKLELVLIQNTDSIIPELNMGKADLIAHGLTVTADRRKFVDFTNYLYLTSQVLVQKKPDNWQTGSAMELQKYMLHDAIDLIGETISVRKNTSYYKRLRNLSREFGDTIYLDTITGKLSTEEIIKKVADGEIKYTVADKNIAQVNAAYYPDLDVQVPVSLSQRIAWAVRKNSPELLQKINQWIDKEKKEDDYYVIYNRYFKNKRDFKRRGVSEYNSLIGNRISKYDDIIKKYAEIHNWDWRLLAALIYQESRFNPNIKSWAGAKGLMQIMPVLARELHINDVNNPEENIKAGTYYLNQLYNRFDQVEDSVERIKFAMASYNCGYSHIKDAIFLADQEKLNSNIWNDNVEKAIIDLSYPSNYNKPGIKFGYVRGVETVGYVEDIFNRYEQYKTFIK